MVLPDKVIYWHHKGNPKIHILARNQLELRLPEEDDHESMIRAALCLALAAVSQADSDSTMPGMISFFTKAKGRKNHECTIEPTDPNALDASSLLDPTEITALDSLPGGRRYSKQTRPDGTIVWQANTTSNPVELVRLVITAKTEPAPVDPGEWIDPCSLGRWSLVPECYRQYWAFSDSLDRLTTASHQEALDLYRSMATCLEDELPSELRLGLLDLRFSAALKTGSYHLTELAAREYLQWYVKNSNRSLDLVIMELGSIGDRLKSVWPDTQVLQFVAPLLAPLIDQKVFSSSRFIEEMIIFRAKIQGAWFGLLILDGIEAKGCQDPNLIARWRQELRAAGQRPKRLLPPQPGEVTKSAEELLRAIDGPPPKGGLTMVELEGLIESAMADTGGFADLNSQTEYRQFAKKVCHYVGWLAGDGPFKADSERLYSAIKDFSTRCQLGSLSLEQKATTLSSLLAVSFYDTSTSDDHQVLCQQLDGIYDELQTAVDRIVERYKLHDMPSPDYIRKLFDAAKQQARLMVADPFFPMLKFPLDRAGQSALSERLESQLLRLESMAERLASQRDSPQVLARFQMELTSLVRQPIVQAIQLRSMGTGIGIRLRWHKDGIPLVTINRNSFRNANEAAETIKGLKGLYLGAWSLHPWEDEQMDN